MKKRIFAVLLALALVVTVGVLAVSAEETVACPVHENCTPTWREWTYAPGEEITTSGHYYLTAAVEDATTQFGIGVADAPVDVVLDLRGFNVTSSGRAFYVRSGSTLTLMDSAETKGVITGGSTAGGGALYVDSGAEGACTELNLYDVTVTSTCTATTKEGGTIYLGNYADLNIHGATINGASAKYGGALRTGTGCTITMDSGLITGGYAGRGGNIYLGAATLRMTGGTISGGESHKSVDTSYGGGNIMMASGSSKVYLSGDAQILDGVDVSSTSDANRGGGNIYVQGLLEISEDALISGGTTNASGGNILNRGTCNIFGGTITHGSKTGTASSTVGGQNIMVRTDAGTLNISGGKIVNGDIAIVRTNAQASVLKLSGAPEIENINFLTTIDYRVTLDALEDGAAIGVSGNDMGAAFTVANENAADYAEYFYGATVRATAVATDGVLALQANNYCPACGGDATWVSWTGGAIADTTSGDHFYLVNNISSGGRVLFGTTDVLQEFCVDYNGYSVHKGSEVRNIYLRAGTTVNLMNAAPRISELTSQMAKASGGVIYTEKSDTNGCTVNLYDGLLLENRSAGAVSAHSTVYIGVACEMNMHGSTIVGHANTAEEGAVAVSGIFNMDGGHIIGADAAGGGAIQVNTAAAELNISGDAVIDGGTLTSERNGGAIYVISGAVNVTGGTINGSTVSGNGGAIYADGEAASVSVSGGTINGGSATNGGGGAIAVMEGASLEVSGTALINGGTAKLGGAIYVADADSSFTMTGGTIQNGKTHIGATSYYGGNLYLGSGSTADISGGTITGGTAYADGGNIFQHQSAGELKISGNAIISNGMVTYYKVTDGELTATPVDSDNTNYGGGNIYVRGTTTIEGNAQIIGSENGVTNCGANIYVRGTLNINGGTISGGKATYQGDCIAVRNAATAVNVSGGTIDGIAVIRSDANDGSTITVSGAPEIGYIDVASYTTDTAYDITLGTLSEGASIGIIATQDEPFTVANAELAAASTGYFFDVNEVLTVAVVGDCLVLTEIEVPVECPHCGEMLLEENWTAWDGGAILNAGHYYVPEGGIKTSGQKQVGDGNVEDNSAVDVCLDLRGNAAHNTNSRMFVIRTKAKLFVMDSVSGGEITGVINASNQKGCVIRVTSGAVFTLHSGTIRDAYTGTRAGRGGAIGAEGANATININGGTVTGLTASYGAAIDVEEGGILNITAGTINGGEATYGGAVCLLNGTMTMSGGTINGGQARYGGAVYANAASSVTISDEAVITGGKAVSEEGIPYGGNIYSAGPFTMTGGTVSNGEATSTSSISRGGNIYIQGSANVHTISGGIISGGNSSGNGGNIYVGGGTLDITGGTITDGESHRAVAHSNGGGNVYGLEGTLINITGGTITNGTTASLGANVYTRGTATISSAAIISGGTSEVPFGCEVAVSGGELTVEGLGDAWSGRIAMTNDGIITNNNVGVATTTYHEGRAFDVWYSSVDAAKAADTAEENTYLALTLDGTYDLDGHVVDVRGKTATINGAATCFDSANDEFEGYGVVTLANAPLTKYEAPNGHLYITVEHEEGSYSFHRIHMAFENISLRPSAAAIYYSASWHCDDVLAGVLEGMSYADGKEAKVEAYGLALKKESAATAESFTNGDKFAYTYFDNYDFNTDVYLCNNLGDAMNSCLLSGIVVNPNDGNNTANAQTHVYVTPYIAFTNIEGETEYLMGESYNNSLEGIVEYFVSEINKLEAGAAKDKLVAGMVTLYTEWCMEAELGLNGDFFAGLAELVAAAQ